MRPGLEEELASSCHFFIRKSLKEYYFTIISEQITHVSELVLINDYIIFLKSPKCEPKAMFVKLKEKLISFKTVHYLDSTFPL